MGKLNGRTAIVTGGGRGIGSGICKALAEEGAVVAVNYRSNREEAEQVVQAIRATGGEAFSVQADISRRQEAIRMIEEVHGTCRRVDILVNNAGISPFVDFFDIDAETWRETIETNLSGTFHCSQAAARFMKDQGGGAIVNISTVSAFRSGGRTTQVHYAASKGGINSLTSSMACALGSYGIRVNTILCGGVVTDINRDLFPPELHKPKARYEPLPLKRLGDPEDLGKAVVFLVSDESSWTTGAQLAVDGGWWVS